MDTELIMGAMVAMATLSLWAKDYKYRHRLAKMLCLVAFAGFTVAFAVIRCKGDPRAMFDPIFAVSTILFIVVTQAKLLCFMKTTGRL